MSVKQSLGVSEPVAVEARPACAELADPETVDPRDGAGGLFSRPASLRPEVPPEAGEPPARSLFAPRGLFRS
ncbi:MAG: hypothetical protein VW475_03780 [Curvibacter sp.]